MKSWRLGLRGKLIALVGGALLALLIGQFIATVSALEEREEETIDEILTEQMRYSVKLYFATGHALPINTPTMKLYTSNATDAQAVIPLVYADLAPGNHERYIGATEYHIAVHDERGIRFVLAYDVSHHERRMEELIGLLGLSLTAMISLTLLGIYVLSGRALAHLEKLAVMVRAGQASPLAHADMEQEVLLLAQALDASRVSQDLLLAREREFSGHLSHELRTPLSVIRTHAELLHLAPASPEESRRHAQQIMEQVDRMRTLIERILRLARAPFDARRHSILMAALVQQVWEDLQFGEPRAAALDCRIGPDAILEADPLLLELILRNALDNARANAEDGVVQVTLEGAVLRIQNPGGATAFTREDGRGLGLAILQRACEALGWRCALDIGADGRACLTLHTA